MAESFGARLRHQRERQQIALSLIADETKISLSLLEGLERDDISQWPGGIFRRSFVRDYARIIGLEPDSVVREFLELYPDRVDIVDPVAPGANGDSASQRPPMRLRYLVDSAIDSLRIHLQRVPPLEAAAKPGPAGIPAPMPMPAVKRARRSEPDLSAVAQLCTELGQGLDAREVRWVLERATRILNAVGLVVWVWDPQANALTPAFVHGYSNETAARLPRVRRDADNATAASFRSAETRVVAGSDAANGAVVVPLLAQTGCVGALAIELQHRGEQRESVRALATILAAQLATFVGTPPVAEAVNI
jgi:transcriptional regulator with XRE-family HTH domain